MTQKILLVEDDATTADFILKGLHEQGLAVDHAKTGRDGLFHATDGSYDAIILAVSHDEFKNMNLHAIKKDSGVIYDVKAALDTSIIDGRL